MKTKIKRKKSNCTMYKNDSSLYNLCCLFVKNLVRYFCHTRFLLWFTVSLSPWLVCVCVLSWFTISFLYVYIYVEYYFCFTFSSRYHNGVKLGSLFVYAVLYTRDAQPARTITPYCKSNSHRQSYRLAGHAKHYWVYWQQSLRRAVPHHSFFPRTAGTDSASSVNPRPTCTTARRHENYRNVALASQGPGVFGLVLSHVTISFVFFFSRRETICAWGIFCVV